MRRFSMGSAAARKVVVLDLQGTSLTVVKVKPDGTRDRSVKTLPSEADARKACQQLARELLARGYVEHGTAESATARKAQPAVKARPAPSSRPIEPLVGDEDDGNPYALVEEALAEPEAPLPRLQPIVSEEPAPQKAQAPRKKKKKGQKNGRGDGLDRRVLYGVAGAGLLLLGGLCFIIYDSFLKPPTIVGTWKGSNTEYEVGGPIIHTEYELTLDEKRRAAMSFQGESEGIGSYSVKGDRLFLKLKDDEGNESDREYRFLLGRVTLDLKDPGSDRLLVQLIRFREPPVVGQPKAKAPAAPTDVAPPDLDKPGETAEIALASEPFSPKDGAFKLRPPPGWQSDTGSRPDNTYSWAKFTKDSATIQVYADIAGSLMSGAEVVREHEEGSESAPVHVAHELYKRTAAEEFSDFVDGQPAVFKGSGLGEGRISIFTASTGGLFGSKIRGYHTTLLSRDRRVTILCSCPEKEFPGLKPTFLAVCRSFSR
ncbi:MAG: hypothetical protein U0790_11520 [Isosphaeraceae bacterium]